MIDASDQPLAENIVRTRAVVELAHARGVSVEAELGRIGRASDEDIETEDDTQLYTDPLEARRFVQETGVDALAISVGTVHGVYKVRQQTIDFERLRAFRAQTDVPLVLHGGSANPDAEIAESVALGITKINISSDIKVAYHDAMREILADAGLREPNVIQPPCIAVMQDVAAHKIRLFNADGKAALY
jgi:fructose-bisphosphate aldolase class II